ncbi:MAG TPA: hypothetical protein VJX67_02675 [Blastocatellia bacterium]|nr:hypothetical protein [Blastocatellia bacterium]
MKSLNILTKEWKAGDTREVTQDQLAKMRDADLYDSYDQTYHVDGLKWKIIHKVAMADGSTLYTLEAIADT